MIQLTYEPIDVTLITEGVRSALAGAVVLFLGTVREVTDGKRTVWLEYESYEEMALRELEALEAEARRRWSLIDCCIVHRLGRLAVGETSVAIAVSAAHRHEAFAAGQWLIDHLKHAVPIWKKEIYSDGSSQWL